MLLDVRILQIVFDDPVRMSMWHDLSGILNFSVQSTLPYAPNFMIIVFICVLCSLFFNLFSFPCIIGFLKVLVITVYLFPISKLIEYEIYFLHFLI